ncbi:transcriptional regulator, sugar-binding domain of SorC family protein [Psychromonas ingrahamii 37]|uniref:Transcriptional regulator, sugar-binding domain of SorC family protein n=1 Tax=Psychromonas ingrahamii (strain DSM 17664 / CCUG 51855 / 37) TaxID=357804 RepID=A1SR46_PSYIN|nr:sugar-binding transcriptional regulator [Psychromonas ingrahamii]ABM01961.1 transcriptional regulator, sugar-binding domain of SorC family protein [Psychromonas ingrahamii 37]
MSQVKTTSTTPGIDDHEMLTEIAILYYQEGATQAEISKKFSISRIKIGRLLRRAREEGVVEINVRYHPIYTAQLEKRLIKKFNLKRVLIALDQANNEEQRKQVAGLVSAFLAINLQDDSTVAVGQGQNVAAVADHVGLVTQRKARFVCAIGGTHRSGDSINADHICRQLAKKFGGTSETLYAPAYVDNPETRNAFIAHNTVSETLKQARNADYALVGVGDMNKNSHMIKLGWFTKQEFAEARINEGIIGDIGGFDFFKSNGQRANTRLRDRVIGLGTEDLRRIPNVIAIASEERKSLALAGALRTGSIDILATSVSCAMTLLNMED